MGDEAKDMRSGRTTSGVRDDNRLVSWFTRYEGQMDATHRVYMGVGRSQRGADYWERTRNPAAVSMMDNGTDSTFLLEPEQTTQLDMGVIHRGHRTNGSVSAFYAHHSDYIEISTLPDVSSFASQARNVSAVTWGAEADARYRFATPWSLMSSLAWVKGQNVTDHRPLGQIPPLEMRLGLNYDADAWSAGLL